MPDTPEPWRLVNFLDRLDLWIGLEAPPKEIRRLVTSWIFTRTDDPYQGARREPGFPNLWFCPIPRSEHKERNAVCCSYWIDEHNHVVRCDSFATLSRPV